MTKIIKGFSQFVNENFEKPSGKRWQIEIELDDTHCDYQTPEDLGPEIAYAIDGMSTEDYRVDSKTIEIEHWSISDFWEDEDEDERIYGINPIVTFEVVTGPDATVKDLTSWCKKEINGPLSELAGVKELMNEGSGPAHTLLRKAFADRGSKPDKGFIEDFRKLKDNPEEYKRFKDISMRTKDYRQQQYDTSQMKKLKPENLIWKIGNYFGDPGDVWIKDLVDEFLNSNMSFDELCQAIADNPNVNPAHGFEKIKSILSRGY
jgi:hypothetical protein